MSQGFSQVKTLVVKLGTTLLTGERGFEGIVLEEIVKDLAKIKHERGLNLLIVSSGAMGCGMERLGMDKRPELLPVKQATAAVGQSRLMHIYEALFQTYGDGLHTAQVLLSASDLDTRRSYLNVRNTVNALFEFGNVVPIVNENDSTATAELRFGDNDTLAARVALKVNADLLVILSNVDGLYKEDPTRNPDAELMRRVESITEDIEQLAGDTREETSIGGMRTKLEAAKIACATGTPMIIANGHRPNIVSEVLDGTAPMTVFGADGQEMPHRKRWIAYGKAERGTLRVDDGARKALVERGKSLLPAGIIDVDGEFEIGEAVRVCDGQGKDLARGLSNYTSREIDLIKGHNSTEIESILGYKDYDVVIHRNNLVIL